MSDGDDGLRYGGPGDGEEDEMDGAIREEGANGRSFDPTPYMRQLRGRGGQGQEYLDVKWRLLWLRREHPDAEIVTDHVQIDDRIAIFKATVTLPSGGKATGYGSETAGDFGDFIEKAETKAIGRALNALGYGAQFGERGDDDPTASAVPAPRAMTPPRPAAPAPAPTAAPARAEPARGSERPVSPPESIQAVPPASATVEASPAIEEAPAPVPIRPGAGTPTELPQSDVPNRRSRGDAPASPTTATPTAPIRGPRAVPPAASVEGDAELAEVSWNVFWPWARSLGYRKREEVEAFIGRPIGDLTPGEVRAMIQERRGESL
jgi:hypothetical protein